MTIGPSESSNHASAENKEHRQVISADLHPVYTPCHCGNDWRLDNASRGAYFFETFFWTAKFCACLQGYGKTRPRKIGAGAAGDAGRLGILIRVRKTRTSKTRNIFWLWGRARHRVWGQEPCVTGIGKFGANMAKSLGKNIHMYIYDIWFAPDMLVLEGFGADFSIGCFEL